MAAAKGLSHGVGSKLKEHSIKVALEKSVSSSGGSGKRERGGKRQAERLSPGILEGSKFGRLQCTRGGADEGCYEATQTGAHRVLIRIARPPRSSMNGAGGSSPAGQERQSDNRGIQEMLNCSGIRGGNAASATTLLGTVRHHSGGTGEHTCRRRSTSVG